MNTYIIGYDLCKPGQNYQNLFDAIESIGNWWHCLDSTWMVKSNSTAAQIRDYLLPHIDTNDRLFVALVTRPAAWHGFDKNCNDWLLKNL